MTTGLLIWFAAIVNEVLPAYVGILGDAAGDAGAIVPAFAAVFPAIGAALAGTPIVFAVTIAVSYVTEEPSEEIKRIVRQCHSPEPMGQQQSAEDVVATDGGREEDTTEA
jgi:cation/acetate symporter